MTSQSDFHIFKSGLFGEKTLKEQVTPYKMAVIVLIQEYCCLKRTDMQPLPSESFNDSPKLEVKFTEREKRNFMITILDLLQATDIPLKELCIKIKIKLNSQLYTIFLKRLQEFFEEGVGAIKDYFQNVPFLLMPCTQDNQPIITKSSVLGLYIRRMILAFDKLTFCQMTDLHVKFKNYYMDANLTNGYDDSQDFGESLTDSVMSLSGVRFSRQGRSLDPFQLTADKKGPDQLGGFNSQRQAEYFILQQAFLLQHNESAAMSPGDLQEKNLEMLKMNPEMAEAHFLSYLNNLRVKEYCTAFHSLFHYFDRKTTGSIEQSQASQTGKSKEELVHHRYAALNMAALHYRFGHVKEAKASIQEAIILAQDMNDHVCLQHALGWLQRLGGQGEARTENLLERAVAKSLELNLPNLTSIGIQAFGKHNAFTKSKPSQVFEYLQKSDILNCQHSQSGFMCTSFANKAALWKLYGKRESTSMMSQMIVQLDTLESGVYFNGESVCIAICNMARLHADTGEYNLATDLINNAKKRFPKKTQFANIWMIVEQEILFDRLLLNKKLTQAEPVVNNFKALNPIEAELRSAMLNKAKGEYTLALKQVLSLKDDCTSKNADRSFSPDFRCRLLLVLAELYSQTGNSTNATSIALECITYAKNQHLEYMQSLATMQLAYIQYQLQLPEQALSLLTQVQLPVWSHGTIYDQGRLLYCYAKCQVAAASKLSDEDRKKALQSSIDMVSSAIQKFQTVEAYLRLKDATYFLARLYHELGNTKERNKCACQFRTLDSQHTTQGPSEIAVL